ncbi:hypothetical protein Hypma_004743 [Hypsizygus marmoreus]|uniref:Uncharacterized protein n=1 Tax=Hypsizygus marmoreus TaxID=39966 RepID=A0A369J266_HYPMA|nr:hypothetical protein Hypma_004743 [Hypsizygus marmoreus]
MINAPDLEVSNQPKWRKFLPTYSTLDNGTSLRTHQTTIFHLTTPPASPSHFAVPRPSSNAILSYSSPTHAPTTDLQSLCDDGSTDSATRTMSLLTPTPTRCSTWQPYIIEQEYMKNLLMNPGYDDYSIKDFAYVAKTWWQMELTADRRAETPPIKGSASSHLFKSNLFMNRPRHQ